MPIMMKLVGVHKAIAALQRSRQLQGQACARGLIRAGRFLQRESMKICPVQFGNLINSAFTRAEGRSVLTKVWVGYTANYAIYVHENLQARHKPGKQAKFLEQPAREREQEMRDIITETAKVK